MRGSWWRKIRHDVAAAVFPHFCVACGREGFVLCEGCWEEAAEELDDAADVEGAAGGGGLDGLVSAVPYARPMTRKLLHLYKYDRVEEAGVAVISLFEAFLHRQAEEVRRWGQEAFVLPVPMHPWKEAWRGFNQADGLAAAFADVTGARFVRGVLGHRFAFKAQAESKSEVERRARAFGAFTLRKRFVHGARFVLVDDVCTTGSTIESCARVLKAAGASEVRAVTFLHG